MARLRARIVALDAAGNVRNGATVKFYQPGTASVSGGVTTGTPFAGSLYASISGGSPISTTQTADANGQVTVYTDSKTRFDVGIEAGSSARVFSYEPLELDPADVVTLSNGQLLVPAGSVSNPSISKSDDLDTGLNFTSTANKLQLVSGGLAALEINKDDATALLRVTRTDDAAAGVLSLVQGSSNDGVSTALGTLEITKYQTGISDLNAALRITQQVVSGSGGFNTGAHIVANAESGWTVNGGNVIGVIGTGETLKDGANSYGSEFFGIAGGNCAAGAVVGIEVNPIIRTGSTAVNRYGVQVVSNDSATVQATSDDVAYRVARKSLGAAFKHAFLVDTGGGAWPLDATVGKILASRGAGTAQRGIDFEQTTFTDSPIYVPGFRVVMNAGTPKTLVSDDLGMSPVGRLHVRDTATTVTLVAQSNNPNRFDGQVQVRGNSDTNKRLYFGVETTTNFGLVQAILNETGTLPLALQPHGGVVTLGDFVNVGASPDTSVVAHLIGTGSSQVALRFEAIKTSTGSPAAGGAGALPATPLGYLHAKLGATEIKWPYYAV